MGRFWRHGYPGVNCVSVWNGVRSESGVSENQNDVRHMSKEEIHDVLPRQNFPYGAYLIIT